MHDTITGVLEEEEGLFVDKLTEDEHGGNKEGRCVHILKQMLKNIAAKR